MWYNWWKKKVTQDEDLIEANHKFEVEPVFDLTIFNVAFAKGVHKEELINLCLDQTNEKISQFNQKRLTKHGIHAVSLHDLF